MQVHFICFRPSGAAYYCVCCILDLSYAIRHVSFISVSTRCITARVFQVFHVLRVFCSVLRDGLLLLSECFIVSFPCCDGRGRQMKNIRENRGKDAEDHRKLLIRSDWCAFQMVQGSLSLHSAWSLCLSDCPSVRPPVRPSSPSRWKCVVVLPLISFLPFP
jgi:hypothetical protein